ALDRVVSLDVDALAAEVIHCRNCPFSKSTQCDIVIGKHVEWQRFTREAREIWFRPADSALVQQDDVAYFTQLHERAHVLRRSRDIDRRRTWPTVEINNGKPGLFRCAFQPHERQLD